MFDTQSDDAPQSLETQLLWLGIWRRRLILLVAVVLSVGLGIVAGSRFGHGTFASEATVSYDPAIFHKAWDREALFPSTLAGMVKTPANLKETAEKTGLPLSKVQAATGVDLDRESGLLHIRSEWADARTAQTVTKTLQQVFLQNTRQALMAEKKTEVATLEGRVKEARRQVAEGTAELQAFLRSNGVTSAEMVPGGAGDAVPQLRLAYTEAEAERSLLARELESIRQTEAMLRDRVAGELAAARAASDAAMNVTRAQALLSVIEEKRSTQARNVELHQNAVEMQRAKQLRDQGLISQQDYERSQEAYEKSQASLSGGKDYNQYKATAHELTRASLGSAPVTSPSEAVLAQLGVQEHTLQIQLGMLSGKAARLQREYQNALALRRRLPALQAQYDVLNHKLLARQADRNELETQLAHAKRVVDGHDMALDGLTVTADADLPTLPVRSRGKLIALMVAGLATLCCLGAIILLEMRDKRLKAPGQVTTQLSLAVLGVVPQLSRRAMHQPDVMDVDFLLIARRLRELVPTRGARILLVSPRRGEGKSLVADALARALRAMREEVALVDADVHASHPHAIPGLSTTIPDVVLVEAPPLDVAPLSEPLVAHADAIVLVVQSEAHDIETLRRTLSHLGNDASSKIVGAIVTKVQPMYMALEQKAG